MIENVVAIVFFVVLVCRMMGTIAFLTFGTLRAFGFTRLTAFALFRIPFAFTAAFTAANFAAAAVVAMLVA